MRTTSLERTEAIFCALTEFRRLLGTENASSINALLKSKGVGHNHIPFIKAELQNRKLVNKSFTKWNDQMSKPTMLMAQSIAEYASRALSAYQKERKLARQHSVDPTRVPVEKLEGVKINPEHSLKEFSVEELVAELRRRHPNATVDVIVKY